MSLTSCLPSNAAFLIIFLTCQSIFTFLLFLQEFLQLLICLQGLVLLMNIMLTFSSASDKSSEIQVRSQQVWIEICAELSTNRISQATHCCLCLQRVPQDSITMQINKQHLWAILFPMPCKEMCRQGQYGPSLVLWQKPAVFGAENNNFIFFLFFSECHHLYVHSQWVLCSIFNRKDWQPDGSLDIQNIQASWVNLN